MKRSYVSLTSEEVRHLSDSHILGSLVDALPFAVETTQARAWSYQIRHLRLLADAIQGAHFFMEFLIPRMGRRADLIIVSGGVIFIVEFKIGAVSFDRSGIDQVFGYALDLKYFHEGSKSLKIVPVLVATAASPAAIARAEWWPDDIAKPLKSSPDQLAGIICQVVAAANQQPFDTMAWLNAPYRPTPTIIEASQALYRGHAVAEISRSEAGAENLTQTANYIAGVIEAAKMAGEKAICFVTGVPGSGKTLAGLNLATARQRAHADEHAVFLSGNGPLVDVLREALASDAVSRATETNRRTTKVVEDRRAEAFIQNIHHFRDDALINAGPPTERVVIFDEAQRAWDAEQTSKFMQTKRGQFSFTLSEPEFLLGVMDRHSEWCAVVCLVGNGQEIGTGEAGIEEWLQSVQRSFAHWRIHAPLKLFGMDLPQNVTVAPGLHLATSLRSFRAEALSDFVGHVISGDSSSAVALKRQLVDYPLIITRDVELARNWLRNKRRGNERTGLVASSNALRLKPSGIFVKSRIEPKKWFLARHDDVRSSDSLEDVATEFEVQGLELDWACLCWDANFRYRDEWESWRFKGSHWEKTRDSARQSYLANSYRVLLTRGRQGLVVFVPHGNEDDSTRLPAFYDHTYRFLLECGFDRLVP